MEEWISIDCSIASVFCAVASLIAAIIIGRCQVKQGERMEALALRQDEAERRQKEQQLKAQRDAFLMKYHNEKDDIYLLPLCWIAAFYNSALAYHRNMFREYNMLEEDVQNAICEYMGLKLPSPKWKGKELYSQCVEAILRVEKKYHYNTTQNIPLFYDDAKYLYRGIEYYRAQELPLNLASLENYLFSLLRAFDENPTAVTDPLSEFAYVFDFQTSSEVNACEICAVAAKVLAEWDGQPDPLQENRAPSTVDCLDAHWIPGKYGYERLETMEDLFLCALFSIYVNLILPQGSGR